MVYVCWQCGDIGLSEALLICIECKSVVRHRYCLEEVPEDLSAEINWSCEDCRGTSPSFVGNAKSPTLTSPGTLDHDSGTPQIEPRSPCHEISSANDHLVDSQDEHPITSVNLDNHMSSDLKRKTLNCAVEGALNAVSSSACFTPNDGRIEEIGNENSKKETLMLSDKDEFDVSQSLVEAPGTNAQFGAKRLPDPSVEAFDKLMIAGTSNSNIGGLGRSSACFGLKEDEINESRKEESKSTVGKNEINNLHPPVNFEGTNFSLQVKRMLSASFEPSGSQIIASASCTAYKFSAVGSFECYNGEVKEQYEKRESKSENLNPQSNIFHSQIDSQGTSISFLVKKPPDTPLEQSDSHAGKTLSSDINALDSIRSSACFTLKEDGIHQHGNGNPKQRLIEPFKDRMDYFHSGIDGEGNNMSFKVEQYVYTSIVDKTLMRATSCETNAFCAVGSSNCFNFKRDKIEEQEKRPLIRMIKPGMNQLDNTHHPIDGQGSKRRSRTSIEKSNKPMMGSTSRCFIGALGVVRSFALRNEGDIKARARTKRKRRRPSRRRRLIPQDKGERNKFQGTPVEEPDKQIKKRIKTGDTFDNRYGEDKSESRNLFLRTEDELSSLQPVIDRRGTNMNIWTTMLPGTSTTPSDRHTVKSVDTNAQIKFAWRGCFNINEAEVGPLSAHLSTKACLKVCNLSIRLPLVLHMQKLPRLVGWPNSFKVSSPTDVNIALYFFAESDRFETVLDELVDNIINNDLMLRFEFDEIELLIFSSIVLPQEHQRFCGKYYLWGVFKPRSSAKISSLPADSHIELRVADTSSKPVRRGEVENHGHDILLFRPSAQESKDYNSRRFLIQPEEGKLSVTANSAEAGKLQPNGTPSGNVELLKEEQLMPTNYTTSESKVVAKEIKKRVDVAT